MQLLSILCLALNCMMPQQQGCYGCYIPNDSDWETIASLYYLPSPARYEGYITDGGSEELLLNALRWHAEEVVDQFNHSGYVLIGGGYGYITIEGEQYLIQNRASYGYTYMQTHNNRTMNSQQQRMYMLGKMSYEQFERHIKQNYAGVLSLKSPNDIGRVYRVYINANGKLYDKGLYIVGDSAASNDWMPQGESINDYYGHERLGYRLGKKDGIVYPWVADLTTSFYEGGKKLSEGLVIVYLQEELNPRFLGTFPQVPMHKAISQ